MPSNRFCDAHASQSPTSVFRTRRNGLPILFGQEKCSHHSQYQIGNVHASQSPTSVFRTRRNGLPILFGQKKCSHQSQHVHLHASLVCHDGACRLLAQLLLKTVEKIPTGGRAHCELISVGVDPHRNRSRRKSRLVTMSLDGDAVGCLLHVVGTTLDGSHVLSAISRATILKRQDAIRPRRDSQNWKTEFCMLLILTRMCKRTNSTASSPQPAGYWGV